MGSHLTLKEREIIDDMKREKKSWTEIARRIGRSKGRVSRDGGSRHPFLSRAGHRFFFLVPLDISR